MEKSLKLVLLGSSCVGKTSIIGHYIREWFNEESNQIMRADELFKEIELINGKIIKIGNLGYFEKFRPVNKIYVKNAKIILLIYDITDERTFKELNYIYNFPCKLNKKEKLLFDVVGNKSDLYEYRIISYENGEEYANKIYALFFEISAMDYEKIENLFNTIVNEYFNLIKK